MIFFLLENLHLWEERRCERSFYRCFLICRLWVRRFYTQKRWVIVFQGAENRPEQYGYFKKRLARKELLTHLWTTWPMYMLFHFRLYIGYVLWTLLQSSIQRSSFFLMCQLLKKLRHVCTKSLSRKKRRTLP